MRTGYAQAGKNVAGGCLVDVPNAAEIPEVGHRVVERPRPHVSLRFAAIAHRNVGAAGIPEALDHGIRAGCVFLADQAAKIGGRAPAPVEGAGGIAVHHTRFAKAIAAVRSPVQPADQPADPRARKGGDGAHAVAVIHTRAAFFRHALANLVGGRAREIRPQVPHQPADVITLLHAHRSGTKALGNLHATRFARQPADGGGVLGAAVRHAGSAETALDAAHVFAVLFVQRYRAAHQPAHIPFPDHLAAAVAAPHHGAPSLAH